MEKSAVNPNVEYSPVDTIYISEAELRQPLNQNRRYDCRWMADPTFRAWIIWQRRRGKAV
ncbi:MAG: hypothetical protein U0641_02320 [Anaerolineae bacterium]